MAGRIGFHVGKRGRGESLSQSIVQGVELAREMGVDMGCVQVFVMGPQNSHVTVTTDEAHVLRKLSDGGIHIYVHSSYITANVYKPESAGYAKVICQKQHELCDTIGASGLVVHLPRDTPEVAAAGYAVAVKYKRSTPVLMEIETAKPPKYLYQTPEAIGELSLVLSKIDRDYGVCIDTAHLWSCGESLANSEDANRWLQAYSDLHIPHTLVHLNDSAQPFGSGIDTHAAIGYGNIWPDDTSGAKSVLVWALSSGIDCILERDEEGLSHDLKLIRSWGLYNLDSSSLHR